MDGMLDFHELKEGTPVDKKALLQKLQTMLDDVERNRLYGKIEIEFVAGHATYIRKMEAEKLAHEATNDRIPRFR
jgi:hypothetical protein